jgi:hypothetical protein
MRKIIFVSHDAGNHAQLIALTEALFPECSIKIVAKTGDWPPSWSALPERDNGSQEERAL